MQGTTRCTNKQHLIIFVTESLVEEMQVSDIALSVDKPN